MSDFKAKMHQIVCRLGLRPRPRWGSLHLSPRLLAEFQGPTSKGGERTGRGNGREGKREGGDRLLSRYTPSHYILDKGLL